MRRAMQKLWHVKKCDARKNSRQFRGVRVSGAPPAAV